MKVRLSYSTDVEAVPQRVSDLLAPNVDLLEDLPKLLSSIRVLLQNDVIGSSKEGVTTTLNLVTQVRGGLAKIDESLADSQLILQGYFDATMRESEPEQEPLSIDNSNGGE